ncbi:TolC family protein [Thermosulfurimonas sp. F29]|uniref:TolC family protein n=1 Tax=Thermosulfurimonas sp. F29 TaxID=2867247 RepID=UPI001C837096|nr:TolC family protein [Thermosulfurimonas sp. F29]MBX6422781.1 TolC family protein [Thermosulfurimonas sp. F29]
MRVLLLWGAIFLLSSGVLAGERLTLEEALSRALRNNPEILARAHEIRAAEGERRAARGVLLPQLDFLAEARRLSDPQAVTPIKGPGKFPAFSRDIYYAGVELRLPLYEGGRLRSLVRLSGIRTVLAESLRRETALDLLANVKGTYFMGLYLRGLIRARERVLAALKREEKDAALRLRVGRVPPLDLLRMKSRVKSEEAALASARQALRRVKEALSVLMGESPRSDFELSGNLTLIPLPREPEWERILFCLPEVEAARREFEAARERVRLERSGHLPRLDFLVDYGRRAGSGLHDDEEVWEAGFRLRLNLFSGGTISARVAAARARELSARERLRQVELSVRRRVLAALSEAAEARARVRALEAARQAAREAFRVESLRYRTGAGTVTDLLAAQAAWSETEAAYREALYRYARAVVSYQRATGEIARGLLQLPCEGESHAQD